MDAGEIAQYLTIVAIIAGAVVIWRGGGGAALTTLETANRILERRVNELATSYAASEKEVAALKVRTDHVAALAPLAASMEKHELRAQARADKVLTVLDLIAGRIGPDNGNGA